MASNPSYRTADATAPAHTANAVTKSDSTTFNPTRGVYVGGAGNIKVDMAYSGTAITLPVCQPAAFFQYRLPVFTQQELRRLTWWRCIKATK